MKYLLGSLIRSSSLHSLFVLDKGKPRKHLNNFNNSIVIHDLAQHSLVNMLRNASNPKLPHKDIARLLTYYIIRTSRLNLRLLWLHLGHERRIRHHRRILILHRCRRVSHLRCVLIFVRRPFSIIILFHIHFPVRMIFL